MARQRRRRAYALIKKAFDAKGIEFAYPTVQIAGNGEAQSVAAQTAIDLMRPPAAARPVRGTANPTGISLDFYRHPMQSAGLPAAG